MWLSLVERIVRDDEAAGSNPVIPIKNPLIFQRIFLLIVMYYTISNSHFLYINLLTDQRNQNAALPFQDHMNDKTPSLFL